MASRDKKTVKRYCTVPTCGKPIGKFGHACSYPGKDKR